MHILFFPEQSQRLVIQHMRAFGLMRVHQSPCHYNTNNTPKRPRYTGLLASVTRDDKIWQGSKYRGIVYYHFAYHFGGKFKLYLVSLLRYGNPTCAIDWFNVPNTVKRKLSFLKTFSKIWTVYHNFNIFSLF